MDILLWVWFIVLVGVALIWLLRHRHISLARRSQPPLHDRMYRDRNGTLPPVTWLVAAKDEQANIEACVRSLCRQEYEPLRVIAVNDRSCDRTGEILDRLAADDKRLTAVHVESLHAGWFGKNNAMREGVSCTDDDWLCFTDADCVQTSARTLSIAMRYAIEHEIDFLSVLPRFETHGFWERVIQPACGGIMMIWFNPIKVNDPARSNAYANGAFMLMRRACYEAIGGHEAFKTQVNEDMHMAQRAKQVGCRLVVVSNDDLYHVRMYASLSQMWAGWSRIFYGCFETWSRLIVSALAVVFISLLPWLSAAAVGMAWLAGATIQGPLAWVGGAAAAGCLAQLSVMLRFYPISRIHPLFAFTYPVGVTIGLAAIINAMRRLHGRSTTTWRGTTYRGHSVEAAKQPG